MIFIKSINRFNMRNSSLERQKPESHELFFLLILFTQSAAFDIRIAYLFLLNLSVKKVFVLARNDKRYKNTAKNELLFFKNLL